MFAAFFWITTLVCAVFIVTFVAALSGISTFRRWQIAGPVIVTVGPLYSALQVIAAANKLHTTNTGPKWWLAAIIIWTVVFIAASVVVIVIAQRKHHGVIAARQWSKVRLASLFIVLTLITFLVFKNVDKQIQLHLGELRVAALTNALKLNPPGADAALNSAPLYKKVMDEFKKTQAWQGCSRSRLSEPLRIPAEFKKILEQKKDSIELLERAASMPVYYKEINLEYGAPVIYYTGIQRAALTISMRSCMNAQNGKTGQATTDLKTLRNMAGHMGEHPTLISNIISAQIYQMYVNTLENVLATSPPLTRADLYILKTDSKHITGNMIKALRNESLILMYQAKTIYNPPHSNGIYRVFVGGFDNQLMAELYKNLFFLYQVDHEETLETLRDYEEFTVRYDKEHPRHRSSKIIKQSYKNYLRSLRVSALTRLSNSAIAATVYKTETGKYPTDLNTLVPDYLDKVPTDPFTKKPLKMTAENGGLILYSVGVDETDNAGEAEKDIIFVLN